MVNIPINTTPVEVCEVGEEHWEVTTRTEVSAERIPRNMPSSFSDFIQTLEAWEVDLLRHTEQFVDPNTLCLELQDGFVAGCDGSEKFGTNGAYGWMISTPSGERAACGMGPSRGLVMDSYRAECSGLLAILRFLIRIAEYTDMFGEWNGTIGTDSQSLLDTLFGRQQGMPAAATPTKFSATRMLIDPLIPEWDLLIEIRNSLQLLPEVQLVYVKGHQDQNNAYERLTLLAQLNIDADNMASQYQRNFGRAHPYALMMPSTGVYLVYPEGTKTANYIPDIRQRANNTPLRNYIQRKYGYADRTKEFINWKAHGKAMRQSIKQRVHIIKMVHECLPTLGRLNRFDSGKRPCPCCSIITEDRDHVIRCPGESRRLWRDKFIRSINSFSRESRNISVVKAFVE